MARKTESDYAKDIIELYAQLIDYPDSPAIQKKLSYRVKKWMEFLSIRIEVAQNEQHEWTSSMLGYPTCDMPTKKSTGYNQIADYVGVVTTCDGDKHISTIIERKAIEDLYNTLVLEDNRERFYREIDRFKADNRFDSMVIIVEGTLTDFIAYQPEFTGGKFDYKKQFDEKKIASINEKKATLIADLFIMGVPVLFGENPTMSAKMCGRILRESLRKGYAKILGM